MRNLNLLNLSEVCKTKEPWTCMYSIPLGELRKAMHAGPWPHAEHYVLLLRSSGILHWLIITTKKYLSIYSFFFLAQPSSQVVVMELSPVNCKNSAGLHEFFGWIRLVLCQKNSSKPADFKQLLQFTFVNWLNFFIFFLQGSLSHENSHRKWVRNEPAHAALDISQTKRVPWWTPSISISSPNTRITQVFEITMKRRTHTHCLHILWLLAHQKTTQREARESKKNYG